MKHLCVALLVIAGATRAFAADVAIAQAINKAAPAPTCTPTCSGWYVGAFVAGSANGLDVTQAGAANSLLSSGGSFGGDAGYRFWNGQYYFGGEIFGGFSEVSLGAGNGYRTSYLFGEVAKFGVGFSGLFGQGGTAATTTSQTPAPINVPAGLATALLSPYLQVGAVERPWGVGWAVGAGADFVIASGWNLDFSYLNVQYNNLNINPIVSQQSENILKVSLNRHF